MPTHADLVAVARQMKRELGRRAFMTIPRTDITARLRQVSGASTTRMKAPMGGELERVLLERGIRCQPSLSETTTGDTIRLFHADSTLSTMVDLIAFPSKEGDKELGDVIRKVKGTWNSERDHPTPSNGPSPKELLRQILPREKHLAFVRSLDDDPDLATT